MGRISFLIIAASCLFILMQCKTKQQKANSFIIEVSNPTSVNISDGQIEIPLNEINKRIQEANTEKLVVFKEEDEIASQIIVPENKPENAYLFALIDIGPNASEKLTIKLLGENEIPKTYTKRTQAEISTKYGGNWEWITKKNGNEQYEYKGGEFKNIEQFQKYLDLEVEKLNNPLHIKFE